MQADAPLGAALPATLATPHDEPTAHEAFAVLSEMYPSADLRRIRAHARRDIRREANRATRTFCAALADVDAALAEMEHETSGAKHACETTLASMDDTIATAQPVLEHAGALTKQSETAQLHEEMARKLLERMTLSPAEEQALLQSDAPVDAALLASIDKLHGILGDALLLMDLGDLRIGENAPSDGTDEEAPSAARIPEEAHATIDLRARASALLDTAYRRIAHYSSSALRRLPIEGAEAPETLRAVLQRLAAREDLFRSVLAAFAETRAALLPDAFVHALTVGGPAPTYLPRPIEMHAHDAVRYVSDMLAWVHQLLAGERELIVSLLASLAPPPPAADDTSARRHHRRTGERHTGLDASVDLRGAGPLLRPGHTTLDAPVFDALVRNILERNVAGCCRPLKVRVLHTMRSQTDGVVVLRLYFLLRFYRTTMQHTIGARAELSTTLRELVQVADESFARALQAFCDARLAHLAALPDADALAATREAAQLVRTSLQECAQAREADVSSTEDVQALERHVAIHFVEPLRKGVVACAMRPRAEASTEPEGWSRYLRWSTAPKAAQRVYETQAWYADIFLVQALAPVWSALQPHEGETQEACRQLSAQLVAALERIAEAHYTALVQDAALESVVAKTSATDTTVGDALHAFLASPELLIAPPRLQTLPSPLPATIHRAALAQIAHRLRCF
ncbi:Golgi transport complex subunit 6 [Malassezia brasiliensis]|uniref:Conserved oligomeric Golgi complex subunit 6 n=1 Tax=Malassezia brasiliensis TaxID=1821822 RepID=A0AAF0INW1_9BASI|nr:Golgi transport complex subunit 6 [Malassezia brasiliensis]